MVKINKHGFSLIELLVVITVIGVLAAIAVPAYSRYSAKVQITSALSTLESVKKQAELYYSKNQAWPTTLADMNLTSTSFNTDLIASLGLIPPPNGCFGAAAYAGDFCVYLRLNTSQLSGWSGGVSPTIELTAITPTTSGTPITWTCTTDTQAFSVANHIPSGYLPTGCINPGGI